jgi:hypothetical protein
VVILCSATEAAGATGAGEVLLLALLSIISGGATAWMCTEGARLRAKTEELLREDELLSEQLREEDDRRAAEIEDGGSTRCPSDSDGTSSVRSFSGSSQGSGSDNDVDGADRR